MSNQTFNTLHWAIGTAVAVVVLTGCTSTTPQLDAKFGETVRAVREQQTVNPAGTPVTNQDLGIGGKAAVNAQERYQDSFKTPPRTFEVLGIGGNLSTQ